MQAKANRGILYVDEVNLLDDGLVDVVLDSAASGINTVEREGISIQHPAKFIMIGSGNPQVNCKTSQEHAEQQGILLLVLIMGVLLSCLHSGSCSIFFSSEIMGIQGDALKGAISPCSDPCLLLVKLPQLRVFTLE